MPGVSIELIPAKTCYPWQVVEGDGETWVILRQKIKTNAREIGEIQGITLVRFKVANPVLKHGKRFYRGSFQLRVWYTETALEDNDFSFRDSLEDEVFCRELFLTPGGSVKTLQREDKTNWTSFPSLLLEGKELPEQLEPESGHGKVWEPVFSWQAWLSGEGTDQEPELVKVHVAKIGFRTLLVEAVLKLETKRDPGLPEGKGRSVFIPPRAVQFTVEGDLLEEALGLAEKRVLYSSKYEPGSRSLCVENLVEYSLVYTSAHQGDERFCVASRVLEEAHHLPEWADPRLQPVYYEHRNLFTKSVVTSENRVMLKEENILTVGLEAPEEKGILLSPGKKPEVVHLLPLTRSKPAERWMKKGKKKDTIPYRPRAILRFIF